MDSPVKADWLTKKSLAKMKPQVGGDDGAGGQDHDVPRHQLVHRDFGFFAAAHDRAGGLDHGLKLFDGFAGAGFLEVAQEDAQNDHDADHDRGAQVAHRIGDAGDHEELDDERIFAALEDFADEAELLALGDFV